MAMCLRRVWLRSRCAAQWGAVRLACARLGELDGQCAKGILKKPERDKGIGHRVCEEEMARAKDLGHEGPRGGC